MRLHLRLDKDKLLQQLQTGYEFADRTLVLAPSEHITEPGVCGHWSVKDLIAHLACWEARTLRWLAEAEQGHPLKIPEVGYGWDQFDQLNDVYYQQSKDRALDDIMVEFHATQRKMLAAVERLTDEELAGSGRLSGMFIDSPADAIFGNGYEHYELHLTQIREWLNKNWLNKRN